MRTRVGYAGGTKPNPTYYDLGDHSETIEIEYDPTQISYSELLAAFWEGHSPIVPPFSRQYASIIFYHDEMQRRLAEESKTREEARTGYKIFTEIRPAGQFTVAEDYHQKHALRSAPELLDEYLAIYPDVGDLVRSTAVARVNGYLGGYGTRADLERELSDLGLSEAGRQRLLQSVRR